MRYSQYDEDEIIARVLDTLQIEFGVFVDVGAGDGTTISKRMMRVA